MQNGRDVLRTECPAPAPSTLLYWNEMLDATLESLEFDRKLQQQIRDLMETLKRQGHHDLYLRVAMAFVESAQKAHTGRRGQR